MNWYEKIKVNVLAQGIARMEAEAQVWKLTVTNVQETNSYFIERWATLNGKIAEAKEKLRQINENKRQD